MTMTHRDQSRSADARRALFDEYMPRIMQCRLEDLVLETPVQEMPALSERLGVRVLIKREDLQPVFSFKLRGAYAKLQSLTKEERARGVICASAGNHAQGVALAARHLGIDTVVVMPNITPEIKIKAVRKLGASVLIEGDDFDDSCAIALRMAEEQGRVFIHPYDDPQVITGQATIGDAVEATRLGAVDVFEKPTDIETLVGKIREARAARLALDEKHTLDEIDRIMSSKGW